ncbi:hydroxysteroid dehydrogenase [Schizopora paradoxa]|uniref:Hydroxysteroid dehydrogenase n=1 Tax=Schizopora paradoxa TaxID=27342 RepID=A0A0H2RPI6_9AGAM|nr:hydroxysteroid dehydrogenase [Schizopora paradoxa]
MTSLDTTRAASSSDVDPASGFDPYFDPEDADLVRKAKKDLKLEKSFVYTYTERDVALYNMGIGASVEELQWIFDGHEEFAAIPTMAAVPAIPACRSLEAYYLPDFDPGKVLHAEQYISLKYPIPTSGSWIHRSTLMQVLDKGKSTVMSTHVEATDSDSGKVICESVVSVVVRGVGGFGGRIKSKLSGPAFAPNDPPKRKPDAVVEEKTLPSQAVLYRLSGDTNPLHILPGAAAKAGFKKPILHGLCTMGFSAKHILKTFGNFKDIKVRFSGIVYPGETLVTEMWKEGNRVIFVTKVKERNAIALNAAAVTLGTPGAENSTIGAKL